MSFTSSLGTVELKVNLDGWLVYAPARSYFRLLLRFHGGCRNASIFLEITLFDMYASCLG